MTKQNKLRTFFLLLSLLVVGTACSLTRVEQTTTETAPEAQIQPTATTQAQSTQIEIVANMLLLKAALKLSMSNIARELFRCNILMPRDQGKEQAL